MAVEGDLRVGLHLSRERIDRIAIASTRPDIARNLLQGRSRAEVAAAVPLLFSICGRSQAAANELACAAASDELAPDLLVRCAAAVSAETLRECAWRTLLDWPQWIGEQPGEEAVAAARRSLAWRFDAPPDAGRSALGVAAFGIEAQEWLLQTSLRELDRWIDAGPSAAARFMRRVRDEDAAGPERTHARRADVALLDGQQPATWIDELVAAADADPDFARHPTWRGAPAETGALARLQTDPLIDALDRRSASRAPARFLARLREFALLVTGRTSAAVGAKSLPSGGGIAWVENARGLLIHHVRLERDRVAQVRIIAPTEWNFHPRGALAAALSGVPAADRGEVKARVARLIRSLDPCVAWQVEFDDA